MTQSVTFASGLEEEQRQDLAALITELQSALASVAEKRPDDVERVTKTAELVVAEAGNSSLPTAFGPEADERAVMAVHAARRAQPSGP